MERVSIVRGTNPIILVAPHGFDGDDERTAYIAEKAAKYSGSYAVINRGWERSDQVDIFNDKADCNNVNHCLHDVVREEFLDPIKRFKSECINRRGFCRIIYIHGMSNRHRSISNDPKMDIVVGFGAGSPNSFTMTKLELKFFMHQLSCQGLTVYGGKKGGSMSGWSKNNLNQYFRKIEPNLSVQSAQIEIVYDLRKEKNTAHKLAINLSIALESLLHRIYPSLISTKDVENILQKKYPSY